jgi:hypothetical protein
MHSLAAVTILDRGFTKISIAYNLSLLWLQRSKGLLAKDLCLNWEKNKLFMSKEAYHTFKLTWKILSSYSLMIEHHQIYTSPIVNHGKSGHKLMPTLVLVNFH